MKPSISTQITQLLIDSKAIQFGDFELKSGKRSKYFINFGMINQANQLTLLGDLFAQTIKSLSLSFDGIFGAAYKGIPLATSTLASLSKDADYHQLELAYNRKERKEHGEGGNIVGHLSGKKWIVVDDVLTAGTALTQSVELIHQSGGEVIMAVIAVDRRVTISNGNLLKENFLEIKDKPLLSLASLAKINDIAHDLESLGFIKESKCITESF